MRTKCNKELHITFINAAISQVLDLKILKSRNLSGAGTWEILSQNVQAQLKIREARW